MSKYFYFGEEVEGYDVRVLNEREARAGAGILFAFAFFSFLYSYLIRDFTFTQIFVTAFMVDFTIRIFINPKYAPSLILGRIMVSNQVPEYVGAAQKRWAWFIGFYLSVIMFFIIVILELMTPVKIFICTLCLILLFSETAFGICIGCKMFNYLYKNNPKLCPGGVCEFHEKEEIQKISKTQLLILIVFIFFAGLSVYIFGYAVNESQMDNMQHTLHHDMHTM